MEKKKGTWGGARPGAGRPVKEEATVPIWYRVRKEDKEFIDAMAEEMGVRQADIIHELVEHFKSSR